MTRSDTFDRQRRIPGWQQEKLETARIAVHGRGWLGAFTVWAFRSLGIGQIIWIGRPRPETEGLAQFLMRRSGSDSGGAILDNPFDIENESEISWALAGSKPDHYVCVAENRDEAMLGLDWADRVQVPALVGRAAAGGWFGSGPPPGGDDEPHDPVISLIVAAQIVDTVRERLCPLAGGRIAPNGCLGLKRSGRLTRPWEVLLVGVGGVGVWAAVALAAAHRDQVRIHLCDFDRVALENLNRQSLYTEDDALERAPKAEAALRALSGIFPQVRLSSEVARISLEDVARLKALPLHLSAILSAVDNAATRLVLQQLGRELRVPVVQGATSTFAADCFTQGLGGPTLDEQMHGALSAALTRESGFSRAGGRCGIDPSYVVPGMLAGAFMAYRLGQLDLEADAPPIRWRMGDLPVDSGATSHGAGVARILDELARFLARSTTTQ